MAPEAQAGTGAAKVAIVAAGGSAKDIEKESAMARLVGAGMRKTQNGHSHAVHLLTTCRLRRYRRTAHLPPRRHNRQTSHVQSIAHSLRLPTQQRNLQIARLRSRRTALLLSLPRPRLRSRIQSPATNIQIRGSAIRTRLSIQQPRRGVRSDVWTRERQGDDACDGGKLDWDWRDRLITARCS